MLDMQISELNSVEIPAGIIAKSDDDNHTTAIGELNLPRQAMREEYLTRELETELAIAWRENGDEESRNRLVYSHMRIVSSAVSKMKRPKGSENDLMQEGAMGLMRAADKFDPGAGCLFSTYARWWVKATLQEAVMRYNSSVRLKSSYSNRTAFFTLSHIEGRAEIKLRRNSDDVTQAEIAAESARMMGISTDRLAEIRSVMPVSSSLNESVVKGEEEVGERIDLLICEKPTPEQEIIESNNVSHVQRALVEIMSTLSEREAVIIKRRKFSLDECTLETLSGEFGVTRERIRQIEARALEKLRKGLLAHGIDSADFLTT